MRNIRLENTIIILALLMFLSVMIGCMDDTEYVDMYAIPIKNWNCWLEKGLKCGNATSEQEWIEFYGQRWSVDISYAGRTTDAFHYILIE